jgi:pilus assembly protein CpaC
MPEPVAAPAPVPAPGWRSDTTTVSIVRNMKREEYTVRRSKSTENGRGGTVMSSKQGDNRRIARRSVVGVRLRHLLFVPVIIAWALLGIGPGPLPHAQAQPQNEDGGAVRHIVVTVNKSRTLRIEKPFASAVVGSPDIVDALPMSDRTLYIQGKKVGTTNVSVFDQSMQLIGVIDVEVTLDTGNLQEKIRASTGSRDIRVGSSNGQIVLSGVAGNAVAAERAVQVAKSMVTEGGTIVNAMTVAPAQQVMLKVRFLEVERSASRELGVNWFGANNGGNRGFATGIGGVTQPGGRPAVTGVDASGNPVPAPGSPAGSGAIGLPIFTQAASTLVSGATPFGIALANLASKGATLDVLLTALETKGLVRRLAEPDLIALSGDTASFLAGGEYPIPAVQPGSTGGVPVITVQYQPFGVQLAFTPTVLENGIINLRLAPSVSELNFAIAVNANGFNIPSINKREARTTVELRDGQSFSIAGLLQTDNRRTTSQLPWIGSVPVLGALFGSKSFVAQDTDLVVIVTPHLVAPAVPGQRLASPLDSTIPSNDVDYFLMGQMEQRKAFRDYLTSGGNIQGPYGHIIGQPVVGPAGSGVVSVKN